MKKHFILFLLAVVMGYTLSAQTIFSEDFNSMTNTSGRFYELPEGWTTIGDGRSNYSGSQADYSSFNDSWNGFRFDDIGMVATSISWLSSNAACDRWLITPAINITGNNFSLVFTLYGYSDSYPESLKVMISTSTNDKSAFTTTLLDVETVPSEGQDYIANLSAYAGQTVYIAFVNYGTNGYMVTIDDVRVTVPIENEITLSSLTLPNTAPTNNDITIIGTVKNKGAAPLTQYQVQYSVDGVNSAVYTVSGINVAHNGTHIFTHNVPYSTQEVGLKNITVTVSHPNGDDDDMSDNSISQNVSFYDGANTVPRTVLLENFTTAQCGNCPSAHTRIKSALQTRSNVVWLAHHVGYGTDNWTISESETLLRFYNANGSIYAPAVMLDRTHFTGTAFSDGSSSNAPGPVFFPSSDVGNAIQTALEAPAFVKVSMINTNYNANTRQVSTTVRVEFTSDLTLSSPRVSLYLMEDSLYGSQSGGSSNYQHDHVIRAAISDITGDAGIITSTNQGNTFEQTYTYTLNNNWNADHCRLVAFASNYSTSDVNDCNVLNTTASGYLKNGNVGIEDATHLDLRIYPNPATGFCVLESEEGIQEVRVINAMGQEVMTLRHDGSNQMRLETTTLASGIYMVKMQNRNGIAVARLVVE